MSESLRILSFAKVNLALAVLGKRPDGFHEIRTVFQTTDLHDEIEFRSSSGLRLDCDGLPGVPAEQNLVWQAAEALSRSAGGGHGAHMKLRKKIPAGSGLGGGSSNAAATLLGLNRFWNLELPLPELIPLAAALGSDVPFFLEGGTALGIGKGDEIYPLPAIPEVNLVVIYPGVHVATGEAYRSLSLMLTSQATVHRIQSFCGQLRDGLSFLAGIFNDFETSILPAYPEIREAKSFLMSLGATAAMLSGSGSSVFGFFLKEESALAASRAVCPEMWRVFPAKTLSHAEYIRRLFG